MAVPMGAVQAENPRCIYRHAKTKKKSHYLFSNYISDASGEISVLRLNGRHDNADLISTAIKNPAKGTYSIYGITFDIDGDLTDPSLLDSEGRVCWDKVHARIEEKLPWLMPRITYAVRSQSGKGIGLLIWIRACEKVADNVRVLALGGALQRRLRELMSAIGIGADPNATGLHRDMANWLNLSRRLYANDIERARVERDHVPVITELLSHVNQHFVENYVPKAERSDVLYPDSRAERRFARTYLKLFDEYFQGKSAGEVIWVDSSAELQTLLGLSKSVFYKVLKSEGLPWLRIERSDGVFRIEFCPRGELTERAFNIVSGKLKGDRVYSGRLDLSSLIPEPQMVADGERNDFVKRVAIEMKHCGVQEADARAAMSLIVKDMPGARSSWSGRNAGRICASIYFNRPELFQARLGQPLPEFIERALRKDTPNKRPAKQQKGLSIRAPAAPDSPPGILKEKPYSSNGWLGAPQDSAGQRSTGTPIKALVDISELYQVGKPMAYNGFGKITSKGFQSIVLRSGLSKEEKEFVFEQITILQGDARDEAMAEWAQKLGRKRR